MHRACAGIYYYPHCLFHWLINQPLTTCQSRFTGSIVYKICEIRLGPTNQ